MKETSIYLMKDKVKFLEDTFKYDFIKILNVTEDKDNICKIDFEYDPERMAFIFTDFFTAGIFYGLTFKESKKD
jgi:hypothetical protein